MRRLVKTWEAMGQEGRGDLAGRIIGLVPWIR